MNILLDFCAVCGCLLRSGLGLEPNPTCYNCGALVSERISRAQGMFEPEDAVRLRKAYNQEPDGT